MQRSDGADSRIIRIGALVSLMALLFFSACGGGDNATESDLGSPTYELPIGPPTASSLANLQLGKPQSCQDNKDILIDTWYEAYTRPAPPAPKRTFYHVPPSPQWGNGGEAYQDTAKLVKGYSADTLVRNMSFSSLVTTYNTQVTGLNEAGQLRVEDDGSLYIVNNSTLSILQVAPLQEMKELATLALKFEFIDNGQTIERATPRRIVLDADRRQIIVIMTGKFYRRRTENNVVLLTTPPALDEQYESNPISIVGILAIDVSDRARPAIKKEWLIEGNYVTARQVGSRVTLVSSYPISPPQGLMGDKDLVDAVENLQRAYTTLREAQEVTLSLASGETKNTDVATLELVAIYEKIIRSIITTAVSAKDLSTYIPLSYAVLNGRSDPAPLSDYGHLLQPKIVFQYPRLISLSSLDLGTDSIHTLAAMGGGGIVQSSFGPAGKWRRFV